MSAKNALLTLTLLAAVLAPAAPGRAAAPQLHTPAMLVQAFGETCREGFPDFDAIGRQALARGWHETSARAIGPVDGAAPPRVYDKDGIKLFLFRPSVGDFAALCQVATSTPAPLIMTDLAAAVAADLSAGDPTPESHRGSEAATWALASGTSVRAGISAIAKTRTVSIVMRQAR